MFRIERPRPQLRLGFLGRNNREEESHTAPVMGCVSVACKNLDMAISPRHRA